MVLNSPKQFIKSVARGDYCASSQTFVGFPYFFQQREILAYIDRQLNVLKLIEFTISISTYRSSSNPICNYENEVMVILDLLLNLCV